MGDSGADDVYWFAVVGLEDDITLANFRVLLGFTGELVSLKLDMRKKEWRSSMIVGVVGVLVVVLTVLEFP